MLLDRITSLFLPKRPKFNGELTNRNFERFMRAETFAFAPAYARRLIEIRGTEHLAAGRGGVLAFLHFGSFFLSGGALVHQLGLPYTLIASRRNLSLLPPDEADFWRGVHRRSGELFGQPLFFSDEPATKMARWLRQGNLLGAAIDVREEGFGQQSGRFRFCGRDIFLHLGPARMAAITRQPLHAMTLVFDERQRRHTLHLGPPITVNDPEAAVRSVLAEMEPLVAPRLWQLYHDLFGIFAEPPQDPAQ